MKNTIYSIAVLCCIFSCDRNENNSGPNTLAGYHGTTPSDTFFILKDSAARMISSYNASIIAPPTDTITSWSIDADALRNYLTDGTIREVQVALAHTPAYINSGNYGTNAGLSSAALTIVLKGINATGATVYYNTEYLLNRAKPCPPVCLSAAVSEDE